MKKRLHSILWLGCAVAAALAALGGCRCNSSSAPVEPPPHPTLRIYALGGPAGAIEPCGCVKDMLGGVDHAAGFFESQKERAPDYMVLGAGPVFFEGRSVPESERVQATLKAGTLAAALRDARLGAFAPAANDLALGLDEFRKLREQTGAPALAANWQADGLVTPSALVERGGIKVGLCGVSLPTFSGSLPEGLVIGDAEKALRAARDDLVARGAGLLVALIAAPRGEALRLAERVQGFQLVIVGKPFDEGENNDTPFPPELIERTLVVQAPNHLQGVSVVDLFLRDGDMNFPDASGIALSAERESLEQRRIELAARLEQGAAKPDSLRADDKATLERELSVTNERLRQLPKPSAPAKGSYSLYDFVAVRESLGQSGAVAARLEAYYQKVNEHNREAFAGKVPEAVAAGESRYVGVAVCSGCHQEERKVWERTAHAGAYATLQKGHKEFNLDCVGCHVTGYERPGGSTVAHVENLSSVQCETCHGPGSRHAASPALAGAIERHPNLDLCANTCHHPPHVGADWDVALALPKILGPGHGN